MNAWFLRHDRFSHQKSSFFGFVWVFEELVGSGKADSDNVETDDSGEGGIDDDDDSDDADFHDSFSLFPHFEIIPLRKGEEEEGEEGEEEKEGKEAPKLVFRLEMAILKSFAITPQVRGVMKGSRLYRPQSLKLTGWPGGKGIVKGITMWNKIENGKALGMIKEKYAEMDMK